MVWENVGQLHFLCLTFFIPPGLVVEHDNDRTVISTNSISWVICFFLYFILGIIVDANLYNLVGLFIYWADIFYYFG
jgi:hypothetical protein